MNNQPAFWNYRQQIVKFLESTRNKTYTIIGLTLLALIIFGAFAIRPTIGTIIKLQNKITQGKQIEEQMQTKIDTLNTLQQQMYQHSRKIELTEGSLPNSEQIDTIIASAETIAEKYDLKLSGITPEEEGTNEQSELLSEYPEGLRVDTMNIRLTGDIDNFQKLVEHFENLSRFLYVTEIGYSQNDDESYSLVLTLNYFYREE